MYSYNKIGKHNNEKSFIVFFIFKKGSIYPYLRTLFQTFYLHYKCQVTEYLLWGKLTNFSS